MSQSRQSELRERAATARKRAQKARERTEQHLRRGDRYFAEVMQNLARTQELLATNAELAIARLTRDGHHHLDGTLRIRTGVQTALEFAQIHRDRGQMRQAHFHEQAADALNIAADALERWAADHDLGRLTAAPDSAAEPGYRQTQPEASAARERARSAA